MEDITYSSKIRVLTMGSITQSWQRSDFETLNTLIIKYKQTGEQEYFKRAWNTYLHNLTHAYLHKFIIKGLPQMAKKLFLCDEQSHELQDVLYEVLLKAIRSWTPNVPERFTRDFAAYYQQAVMNFAGNLLNRCKRKKYQQMSIINVDFSNEEEVNLIAQGKSNVWAQIQYHSTLDAMIMNDYLNSFINTQLTKEQALLFELRITKRMPIQEIASHMGLHRMTIHRKWKELQSIWLAYEQG